MYADGVMQSLGRRQPITRCSSNKSRRTVLRDTGSRIVFYSIRDVFTAPPDPLEKTMAILGQ